MKYILDDLLVFRTDDGTIWPVDHEENKIILSPIVSRLLTLLLEEQGKVLTRDEILRQVWAVHGLEPSGNSLNQYISHLRKNMSNFGLNENAIRTIPRIGFMFDESITVIKSDDMGKESLNIESNLSRVKPENIKTIHKLIIAVIAIIMVFFIPSVMDKISAHFNIGQNVTYPITIGTVNGCKIYGVKKDDTLNRSDALSLAQRVFNDYKITCQSNNEIALLFAQGGMHHNNVGRVFIALCTESNGALTSCKSKSFNNW